MQPIGQSAGVGPMSFRPVFRIASAGLDPRDVRLIEIVFQHSQYNKYDFQMLDDLDLTRTDILIANPSDPAGLDAMSAVGRFVRPIPTVAAVPRGAQLSARHSITIDRLTLQLLPILNRVVEQEMLEMAALGPREVSYELTEIHADEPPEQEPPCRPPDPVHADPVHAAQIASAAISAASTGRAIPSSAAAEPCRTATASCTVPAATAYGIAAFRPGDATADEAGDTTAGAADDAIADTAEAPVRTAPGRPAPAPEHLFLHLPPEIGTTVVLAPPQPRLRALVADPSSAAQQQLARALERIGLEVHCVTSGAAAAQWLAREHHDLIVTESALTDCDGFALIRHLRLLPAYRYTPVLLLRSRLQVLDKARARLDGDVTVLAKPLSRGALERIVLDALRQSVVLDDLKDILQPVRTGS